MGRPHIVTHEERVDWLNLQWSLQPSPKDQFIAEIEMHTFMYSDLTGHSLYDINGPTYSEEK